VATHAPMLPRRPSFLPALRAHAAHVAGEVVSAAGAEATIKAARSAEAKASPRKCGRRDHGRDGGARRGRIWTRSCLKSLWKAYGLPRSSRLNAPAGVRWGRRDGVPVEYSAEAGRSRRRQSVVASARGRGGTRWCSGTAAVAASTT
jgi:hypothetical protein